MSINDDGLGAMPRPIPIIIGAETKDVGKYDWWVTIKVVEHGFPDVAVRHMILGHALVNTPDMLTALMDHMIRQLASAVGRRHGIWVCTVTVADFAYGAGFRSAEDSYRDTRVAQGVRELARAASVYSPLIMYDPNRMTASLYEAGNYDGILRESLRETDLMGLAEEAMRGCKNCGHPKSDHRSRSTAVRCLPAVAGGCDCSGFA